MNFLTITRFIIFLILVHFKLIASGANYYWVGGSGKWSDYSIHWATSSGGSAFHPQVPTNLDNVYFDQNSGFVAGNNTVTIDQTIIYCKDMDWTGAVGNPVLTTTLSSNVIKIFGSVKFISSMKFSFTGTVSFESTSTGNTITSSGQTILGDVLFNGSGGSWTLNDSLTVSNGVTHNLGLLNTNNQTFSAATFFSTSANTRSLNFGTSLIKIYGHPNVSSGVFQLWDQNLTLNAGTSTIQFFGQGGRLIIQWGLTLYNVKTSNLGNFEFNAGGNFHKIEMNSDGLINVSGTLTLDSLILYPGKTYDISGAIQINAGGNLIAKGQCKEQITIRGKGGSIGYLNTPSGTVTNIEYCILKDFNAIGSGIFNAVNSYSLGNTNNWNITNPVGRTFYWIGGGGNWNDSQHWSLTSGGNADAGCTPTLGDNVVFDQNAGFTSTNKNVLINSTYAFSNDLTWTNAPNHPVFQLSNSSTLMVNGSFTLMKDMDLVLTGNLTFCATTSGPTITSASKVFNLANLTFQGNGGVWNLTDSLTTTPATTLNLLMGTLNSNNQNITAGNFTNYSKLLSSGKSQLNLGSSTMRLTGPSFAWDCFYDYPHGMILTLNAGTSTIIFQNNNQSQSLKSEGQTFYNVLSTNPVSIDINGENNIFHKLEIRSDFAIYGSAQYDSLILNPGSINRFKGASTQTIINGTLVANGSCSSPIYIECLDAGKTFTFIKTSGSVNVNYAILKDANATGVQVL